MIRGLGFYDASGSEAFREGTDWQVPITDALPRLRALQARTQAEPDTFVWLGLYQPTLGELSAVAEIFELPTLQLDDALNPTHRPEVDWSEDGRLFVIMKVLDYVDASSDVLTGQIAMFAGPGYVITVRFGSTAALTSVRRRLDQDEALRRIGPMGVVHALVDDIVDGYLTVVREIETDIEELEALVFAPVPIASTPERLYRLKRENIEIRRAVAPLIPVARDLHLNELPWVPDARRAEFRDIGEHLLRVEEAVEWADNLLMTMLSAATQLQDLQQNRDMRKISAWVAIAAVPTMIAGIYGMNFEGMPELRQPFGYPVVLLTMATACGLLFRAFKRSGWL